MERNTELGGNLGVTRKKERALNSLDVQDPEDNATVELLGLIEAAGSFTGFRRTHRKECLNFVRRLKLLIPLLEEMRESARTRPDLVLNHSINLRRSLQSAKKLLKFCNSGSKIFLAIEGEAFMGRFHSVYDKLHQALDEIPYRELGISVEAREQVELLSLQLRRAKGRADTQDIELAMDMMVVFSEREDRNADIAILQRLAMKLDLHTVADLKEEARAIRKLIKQRGGDVTESLQQVIDQLSKFKQIVGIPESNVLNASVSSGDPENNQPLSIPHEFLCPITLEIMTDPVIVATGQTYERESIEKWLDAGHSTCPKTGQTLLHLSVAPNFALRNLIMQWCEKNNFELPKKERHLGGSSIMLMEEICSSVQALSCCLLDLQRMAVIKIRMLSKENPNNRILIAKVGGIPPLVTLLSYPDMKVQEHAVTALLNLSIDEANKKLIARQGAVPDIIEILQNGTDEARENSAATLFSLSTLDENKALVGCSNGIPPLVALLQSGTARGKKDAATALFNLCLNLANKPRAIRAGIIPALLDLLKDKNLGMIDEALSIMLLLVSHPEGREEAGQLSFIETLVEIMRIGTSKNKECAASVLLELGSSNLSFILAALQFGVYEHLVEISRSGTNRAQRKACSLLQQISRLARATAHAFPTVRVPLL